MDKSENVSVTLPKGDLDAIEVVETRSIDGFPGVYELLINGKSGRVMVDLSQFENSEEALRTMYTGVGECFIRHHLQKLNGQEAV